jgi:hypothetical protein
MAAHSTTQQSMAEAVDVDNHLIVSLFDSGHRMSLQPQLFSDKCLYEHLESDPFIVGFHDHNNEIGQRCSPH